jgi:starch phosphorylase
MATSIRPAGPDTIAKLIGQYNCGPVKFTGAPDGLYERHLLFDNVTDIRNADARSI